MSVKLEGKWYISLYDDTKTGTYPDCTEVEIFEGGPWIKFKSADGKIHVTSFPTNLRSTKSAKTPEGE
jgi:hypothetical protein